MWIAMQVVLLLLAVAVLEVRSQANFPFTYVQASCSETQYFDSTSLRCRDCGTGQSKSSDGMSCVCNSYYRKTQDFGGTVTCAACPSGQVASKDGWSCVSCSSAADAATGYCPACPTLSATAEYQLDGTANSAVTCVACTSGTYVAPDGSHCIPCPNLVKTVQSVSATYATCDCSGTVTSGSSTYQLQLFGGVCFAVTGSASSSSDATAIGMTGISAELQRISTSGSPITSLFLTNNLAAAFGMCSTAYNNRTACQLVGSACALLLYRQVNVGGSTRDACALFEELSSRTSIVNSNADWKSGLPWLYHSNPGSILTSTGITTQFTRLASIQFLVGVFSQNGTFEGYQEVTDGLLQLCQNSRNELNAAYAFGTRYSSSCNIQVDDLFNQAKYPLKFYDIYLRMTSASGVSQLFPVPVKILNVENSARAYPNTGSNTNDFVLTRRFFLVDNVAGVTTAGSRADFVRYASTMRFDITLINTDSTSREGRIYPPVLTIQYSDIASTDYGTGKTVAASFQVTYFSDLNFFWEALKISMGVLGALAGVYSIFRAFAMHSRSGGQNFEATVILHLIAFACSSIANIFLIVVYGCTVWYFTVYKNQSIFAFFIPTTTQELNLTVYIAIAGALKLIEIIYLLVIQSRVDIFLMDWEKPKTDGSGHGGNDEKKPSEVTYWRTILVANEWNEIQTHRKTNRIFTLLIVLFFMNVLGFENYASGDPKLERLIITDEYRSSSVSIFRFAIAVSVFIGAGGIQWLWTLLVHERFIEDKLRNFVDLCSICNISVFIRYPRAFGYYIHGESPHSTADVGVSELHKQFEKEKSGQCDRRGLDNTDNQTFMMRLPPNFLTVFDGLNRRLVETASSSATGTPDAIYKYHEMNKFLTDFIHRKDNMRVGDANEAREIEKFQVQARKFLEDVVGLELGNNEELQQGGIFYSEDGTSFGDVLFYGNELSLMTFDILVYCCVDLIFGSSALNVIVTWLIGEFIDFVRHHFGEINLSRKTLTDRQFLI